MRHSNVAYLSLGWVQGALFKGLPLPLGERKTCLQVAFLMGLPVKSAFALLLARVTEPPAESERT